MTNLPAIPPGGSHKRLTDCSQRAGFALPHAEGNGFGAVIVDIPTTDPNFHVTETLSIVVQPNSAAGWDSPHRQSLNASTAWKKPG